MTPRERVAQLLRLAVDTSTTEEERRTAAATAARIIVEHDLLAPAIDRGLADYITTMRSDLDFARAELQTARRAILRQREELAALRQRAPSGLPQEKTLLDELDRITGRRPF